MSFAKLTKMALSTSISAADIQRVKEVAYTPITLNLAVDSKGNVYTDTSNKEFVK